MPVAGAAVVVAAVAWFVTTQSGRLGRDDVISCCACAEHAIRPGACGRS
jgi:hypothetical protein